MVRQRRCQGRVLVGRLAATARERRAGALPACRRSTGVEGGHVAHRGKGVDRPCTGPGPNIYRLALFRFAQDAFSRFDMAFLAAALIGARFRFCVAVG